MTLMNRCCKVLIAVLSMLCVAVTLQAQYKVAITIDDMPKPRHFGGGAFATELTDALDSLQIPVAIFINDGNIHKGNGQAEGRRLLERWIGVPWVIPWCRLRWRARTGCIIMCMSITWTGSSPILHN